MATAATERSSSRWERISESHDLRAHLDRNYPRASKRIPDGAMGPLQSLWRGWSYIGYFRYLILAAIMASIPLILENDAIMDLPIVSLIPGGSSGTSILVTTGIFILLALGLSVVVGLAGLLDLGYAAFFMLGAYTTALMTASGGEDQFHFVEWPTWGALPFALAVAMVAGFILGAPTLRLRGDYLAIVTLGFHEMVRLTMNNLTITNGSRGIPSVPHPNFLGFDFGLDSEYYWWFLLIPFIILAVIMIKHLDNSRIGRYWTAIREDEVAAAAMGVPVVKTKLLAFIIGASTSGVAGWVYATYYSYIAPNSFPLLQSILILSAVVVGGLGSVPGAVLGGILITALPEIVRENAGDEIMGFDPETGRIAIFGFLLIIIMIYRPGGLLAARRRRVELSEAGASDAVVVDEAATVEEARIDSKEGSR